SRHGISLDFFFQAEDGIRDFHVTGVQTCALPIFDREHQEYDVRFHESVTGLSVGGIVQYHGIQVGEVRKLSLDPKDPREVRVRRSEERRVGKEWRSRWEPYDDKKKRGTRQDDNNI